ncbi:uncharacterized protein LOC134195060 [Corticium candelabrum]|uniref:uncharacterized protein LOC134195060 n=1 Tax=Corticium candelabrum TaxID=121492 RepID=UPI002E268ED4|nr:uncharacterized protein LOC134195060 [Corticium candelabrum]
MSERKKKRLKWWQKHMEETKTREHREDVIITSKQRKGQRCLTKSQTKKTKDSVSQAAVGAPTSDADSDGHPTDQVDEGKTPVRKSRYTLFVGNLPYDVTAASLESHFNKGGISGVRLLTKRDSGMSRGCAFIDFTNPTSYMAALQLHHSLLGDRKINVEATCGGGGQSKQRKKRLEFRRKKWRQKIKQHIEQKKTGNKQLDS